jgi:hypothetical protein
MDGLGCGALRSREGIRIYALHPLPFAVDRTALNPRGAEPNGR